MNISKHFEFGARLRHVDKVGTGVDQLLVEGGSRLGTDIRVGELDNVLVVERGATVVVHKQMPRETGYITAGRFCEYIANVVMRSPREAALRHVGETPVLFLRTIIGAAAESIETSADTHVPMIVDNETPLELWVLVQNLEHILETDRHIVSIDIGAGHSDKEVAVIEAGRVSISIVLEVQRRGLGQHAKETRCHH